VAKNRHYTHNPVLSVNAFHEKQEGEALLTQLFEGAPQGSARDPNPSFKWRIQFHNQ